MNRQRGLGAAVVALLAATLLLAVPAGADTFPVSTTTDGGAGSLRAAVDLANANPGDDTIVLEPGLTYDLTICADDDTNAGGDLDSTDGPLTIEGNGSTIRQTCPGRRVLDHESDESLTLDNVTITGGTEDDTGGGVSSDGPTTVIESAIVDNSADDDGGGIYVDNDLFLTRSTVARNTAGGDGGGVYGDDDAFVTNSTIADNSSGSDGGGIYLDDFDIELTYATISSNASDGGGANVDVEDGSFDSFGSVIVDPIGSTNCGDQSTTTLGYNYSDDDSCELDDPTDTQDGVDPSLGALGDNGGPTPTMLPAMSSPLVDAIPASDVNCTGTDQRGVTRPQFDGCDIGSVELSPEPPPETTTSTVPATPISPVTPAAQAVATQPTFTG